MKKVSIFAALFVLLIAHIPANAEIKKAGQAGLKFLDVTMSARSAGMGDAFLMIGDDANALFYNPAGIAQMNAKFDVFAGMVNWIADINFQAAGLVVNAGNWGCIGVNYISVDYGDIHGTKYDETVDAGYSETGLISAGAYAAGLSYARRLTNKFMMGGKIQFAYEHLGSSLLSDSTEVKNEVSGLVFDFGTMFYPGSGSFRLGMTVSNFSTQFQYEQYPFQLPLTFRVSAAFDILDLFGGHPDNSLVVDIEGIHPRDYTQRLHIGGEYWFRNMFAIRAGYKFNYDVENITAGFGINMLGLKFDYSYCNSEVFDRLDRFSLGYSF